MMKETWKRQTFWTLPVYTGDVSGVCSALYELGGMVVMHDPSGCNSTYNTHDEIRWMDQESLIFLSGLKDIDAITGNDQKLIDDIVESASIYHPKFIAIANSPVPWLIGTDFRSICRKVQQETGIPAFHVETNAMHDYTYGAGRAFLELARMLFEEEVGRKLQDAGEKAHGRIRVNILGVTPLDLTVLGQVQTLREILAENEFDVVSVWGTGDGMEVLKKAPSADVNLVVSSAGLLTAAYMKEKFGISYVAGVPTGAFGGYLMTALREAAQTAEDRIPYLEVLKSERRNTADRGTQARCVCGEPVTMGSVAADLAIRDHCSVDLIRLTETAVPAGGLTPDVHPQGEEEIRQVLSHYTDVTADPMLKIACRKDAVFHELPHFAYSGRLYLNQIRPLILH